VARILNTVEVLHGVISRRHSKSIWNGCERWTRHVGRTHARPSSNSEICKRINAASYADRVEDHGPGKQPCVAKRRRAHGEFLCQLLCL